MDEKKSPAKNLNWTNARLQKLLQGKIFKHIRESSAGEKLPKDQVLYILIKREIRKFFEQGKGNAYSEENYKKLLK